MFFSEIESYHSFLPFLPPSPPTTPPTTFKLTAFHKEMVSMKMDDFMQAFSQQSGNA